MREKNMRKALLAAAVLASLGAQAADQLVADLPVKSEAAPNDRLVITDADSGTDTKLVSVSDVVDLYDEMITVPDYGTVESIAYPGDYTIGKYEVCFTLWYKVFKWSTENGYAYDGYSAYYDDNDGDFEQATRGPGGAAGGANQPVLCVTLYDCAKWCNARSEMEGLTPAYYTDDTYANVYREGNTACYTKSDADGYRLPTSEEWEYAARAGTAGDVYPWGTTTISADYLNYNNNLNGTTVCGAYPQGANALGVFDLGGNAWEWTYESDGADTALLHGGGFNATDTSYLLCSGTLSWSNLDHRHAAISFRCVQNAN